MIEPDKGGLAGYALVQLYLSQANYRNLEHAKHFADVLVRTMRAGDARHAPWPFRVDAVTGKHWGERNGNIVYILRLFDEFIALGFEEYLTPRKQLWNWIQTYQLQTPEQLEEKVGIPLIEDETGENDCPAWVALELARYLIEKKESLYPQWKQEAEILIQFVLRHYTVSQPGGITGTAEPNLRGKGDGGIRIKEKNSGN